MNWAYYAEAQGSGTLAVVFSAVIASILCMAVGRFLSPVLARRGQADYLVWYVFGTFFAADALSWAVITHFFHDHLV